MAALAYEYRACNRCGAEKPHTDEFFRRYCKSGDLLWQRKLKAICRECELVSAREWQEGNKERARARAKEWYNEKKDVDPHFIRRANLKNVHGISLEDYEAMSAAQKGKCAICGRNGNIPHSNGKPQYMAVDHDHETGELRGLLCSPCNLGLGLFQDNDEFLTNAARYLARRKSSPMPS